MPLFFESLPIDYKLRITSPFGWRDVSYLPKGSTPFHAGVDIGGNRNGITHILAVKDGIITSNFFNVYRGNTVIIKHDDEYSTLYQHMRNRCPKPVGSKVKAGEVLGIMGCSGSSAGVHLHFELRENGKCIDPLYYLKNIKEEEMKEEDIRKLIREELTGILKSKEPSKYHKEAWQKAMAEKITDGSRPHGYATREEVITMIERTIKRD